MAVSEGTKGYKKQAQITTTVNKALDEFLKDMLEAMKSREKNDNLIKIIENSRETGSIGQATISPRTFNHMAKILKANDIPFRAENIGNDKNICIFFRSDDKELVQVALKKAEMQTVRNNGEPISAKDFYTNTYKEKVVTIGEKDIYWLHDFKKYAEKYNLAYCAEETRPGVYKITATENDREKMNKAVFSTEWDMTGRFKSFYQSLAQEDINRREENAAKLSSLTLNGGVYMVSLANMNDKLLITKDGYKRMLGDIEIDSGKAGELGYNAKLEKNKEDFGSHRQHVLVSRKGYEESLDKNQYVANVYRAQNRINITKKQANLLQESRKLRDQIMERKDFKKTSAFTKAEYKEVISIINGYYAMAQKERADAEAIIDKALANGASVSRTKDINMALSHVQTMMKDLKETNDNTLVVVVDETNLQFNEIKVAQDLYKEKVNERRLYEQLDMINQKLEEMGIDPNSISGDNNGQIPNNGEEKEQEEFTKDDQIMNLETLGMDDFFVEEEELEEERDEHDNEPDLGDDEITY